MPLGKGTRTGPAVAACHGHSGAAVADLGERGTTIAAACQGPAKNRSRGTRRRRRQPRARSRAGVAGRDARSLTSAAGRSRVRGLRACTATGASTARTRMPATGTRPRGRFCPCRCGGRRPWREATGAGPRREGRLALELPTAGGAAGQTRARHPEAWTLLGLIWRRQPPPGLPWACSCVLRRGTPCGTAVAPSRNNLRAARIGLLAKGGAEKQPQWRVPRGKRWWFYRDSSSSEDVLHAKETSGSLFLCRTLMIENWERRRSCSEDQRRRRSHSSSFFFLVLPLPAKSSHLRLREGKVLITCCIVNENEQDLRELSLSLISEIYLYKWRGVTERHDCSQKTCSTNIVING